MSESHEEGIERAAKLIGNASFVLVMAGAGLSAESGLKTYQEIDEDGCGSKLQYADYCDPDLLHDDPLEFWKFWSTSYVNYSNAVVHNGYCIIKKWRDRMALHCPDSMKRHFASFFDNNYDGTIDKDSIPTNFFIYTSNVDSLFRKAGFLENEILEIHGNVNTFQCCDSQCCQSGNLPQTWKLPQFDIVKDMNELPRCIICDKICRPYVLMFNDEEWLGLEGNGSSNFELYDVWEEGLEAYIVNSKDASVVIIEIGCGDRVPVVKMESETVLGDITNIVTNDGKKTINDLSNSISLIRINTQCSAYLDFHEEWSKGNSHIDPSTIICLEGKCSEILESIDRKICE